MHLLSTVKFSPMYVPMPVLAGTSGAQAATPAPATGTHSHTSFLVWLIILGIVIPGLILGGLDFAGFKFIFKSR